MFYYPFMQFTEAMILKKFGLKQQHIDSGVYERFYVISLSMEK